MKSVKNSSSSETLQRFLFLIILAISFFIILTYLLSMALGILVFFSTAEGLNFSGGSIQIYPLLLIDFEVTVNAGLYFIFLWWIFTLCFAAAWKFRESLSRKIRKLLSRDTKRNFLSNNLLAMPAITSTLLVAVLVLHFLQTQGGIPTGEPDISDPFLDLIQFSRAPLVEEIIFRIIPIGTFLATYIFLVGKSTRPNFSFSQRLRTCILSVLQPEEAKKIVGLKTIGKDGWVRGVVWTEWVMIFFTSSLFGIAHYLGGWGPGKISQAAISGAVFALAYFYYGVQAPILLHWYFNYYFTVFDLSSSYYSAQVDFAYSLTVSANLFLGILMWVTVIILGAITLCKLLRRKPEFTSTHELPRTNI